MKQITSRKKARSIISSATNVDPERYILMPEEAFFLVHALECLEVVDEFKV